jgi:hypothetical protein
MVLLLQETGWLLLLLVSQESGEKSGMASQNGCTYAIIVVAAFRRRFCIQNWNGLFLFFPVHPLLTHNGTHSPLISLLILVSARFIWKRQHSAATGQPRLL